MKKNGYRLIGLNLVLLMLLISAFPVFALETTGEKSTSCALTSEYAEDASKYLLTRDSMNDVNNNEDALESALLSGADEPYVLRVGNTSFYSDEIKSGTGWTYDGNGSLELNNYVGGSIFASGDLTIYSKGSVSIKGSSGAGNFGGEAVCVAGNADVITQGTFSVIGGYGNEFGGTAVYAAGNVNIITQGTFSAIGGDGKEQGGFAVYVAGNAGIITQGTFSAIGGSGNEYGGDGLVVNGTLNVDGMSDNASFKAIGGAGSNDGGYGGWGISAGNVYLDNLNDCDVQGGAGENPVRAIFSNGSCEFGLINAHIKSGDPDSFDAIGFDESVEDKTWYYNEHTSVSGTNGEFSISINEYTLTLQGNGGTRGTSTFSSLKNYYPKEYYLPDYIFSRDGYTQVAWRDNNDEIVELTTYYTPGEDVVLKAEWEETQAGDILLNGVWYTFDDGDYFKKTNNVAVTLPSTLKEDETQVNLIGWHSNAKSAIDENGVIGAENKWYMTGDTVEPNSSEATILYAEEKTSNGCCYVLYHTAKASTKAGSKLVVQSATSSDLVINAEDYMTVPDGYSFAGWATQENGETLYNGGEAFSDLNVGDFLELYAIWQLPGTCYGSGDVCAWVDSKTKTIRIEPQDKWYKQGTDGISDVVGAVYDEKGQMISCASISNQELCENGFIELHYTGNMPAVAKFFTLSNKYEPVSEAKQIELR